MDINRAAAIITIQLAMQSILQKYATSVLPISVHLHQGKMRADFVEETTHSMVLSI